jgi:UDP-N-acetylmuramyl pentapeptide phosphotransferase/UDP-N-acetylglucosamine-1-phosphate transferase
MKSITIVGVLFIIIGILTLTYQGFSYTKQEKIFQMGDINVTADTQKTVYVPPVLGGLSIVAGVILVIVGKK